MGDPRSRGEAADLPPALRALDADLRAVSFVERPSFAPELGLELERLARALGACPRRRPRLVAAAALGLVFAGVASVVGIVATRGLRASLADLVRDARGVAYEVLRVDRPVSAARDLRPALGPGGVAGRHEPGAVEGSGSAAEAPLPAVSPPMLRDVSVAEALVRTHYPADLQRAGIGGRVRLLVRVDAEGAVRDVRVVESSGEPRLDVAARNAALQFTFYSARRDAEATAALVELPVYFKAETIVAASGAASGALVSAPRGAQGGGADRAAPPPGSPAGEGAEAEHGAGAAPFASTGAGPPGGRAAPLRVPWAEVSVPERGEPAAETAGEEGGRRAASEAADPHAGAPWQWREEAVSALEGAVALDAASPAPFLALGRIRKKQGARGEAMRLFERGLERAAASTTTVPPRVLADLHYERASLLREEWLEWESLGRVPADALGRVRCEPAVWLENGPAPTAPGDALVAWNYLCPREFDAVMDRSFVSIAGHGAELRRAMMEELAAAVAALPGHGAATVELLLAAADDHDWNRVLEGARRFTAASEGDPRGYLLEGMALHGLGRCDEAMATFRRALERLPAAEAARFEDPVPLLSPDAAARFGELRGAARAAATRRFWAALDPLAVTDVNERLLEHYARAAYTWLRFGSLDANASEVWIRYGRPRRIRAVGEGTALRTVFWDYGLGPDIPFRRPARDLTLELTPEGRAYLEELSGSQPHTYGPGPVRVEPLEAQLARFRAERPGTLAIELHGRLPEDLGRAGATDSLELGVVLVDGDGAKRVLERRRVSRRERALHLRVEAPAEPASVVLEVLDARAGRAYRFGGPVSGAGVRPGEALGISDPLLLEAAPPPGAPVTRTASWVRPLASAVAAQERLALLVEVYGLQPGEYSVEVLLDAMGAGATTPLRLLKREYGVVKGEREGVERTTEFLLLDLAAVAAGSGLLRVRVIPAAEPAILESRRTLAVR